MIRQTLKANYDRKSCKVYKQIKANKTTKSER